MELKKMKKLSVIWGVFLVIIVVMLTFIGFVYKNKSDVYKDLEKELVSSAKKYVDAKFLYPEENKTIKITYDEMKSAEYIGEIKKDEQECAGYVLVSSNGMTFDYKGFVKCSNYTTKGYE